MCVCEFEFEPGDGAQQQREQDAADRRVVVDLGLEGLVYGWREGRSREPVTFEMAQHAWELYRLPAEADRVAHAVLAKTSERHVHWLLDWPGRDRVLLRRPPDLEPPAHGLWSRLRGQHEVEQRLRDSAAILARLDRELEQVEVLEPLYVERARLAERDWTRTVALLSDARHIALCPWDWYQFIVADFVESCREAVRREREQ
jgi:hypothetical protein